MTTLEREESAGPRYRKAQKQSKRCQHRIDPDLVSTALGLTSLCGNSV